MHSKHAKRQNIFSSSLYSEGNSRAEVQHNSEIAYRHIQSQIIASRSEFRTLSKDEFILLKFLASYILFKSGKMDKMYNTRLSQAQGGSYVLDIRGGGRPWALGVCVLNWEVYYRNIDTLCYNAIKNSKCVLSPPAPPHPPYNSPLGQASGSRYEGAKLRQTRRQIAGAYRGDMLQGRIPSYAPCEILSLGQNFVPTTCRLLCSQQGECPGDMSLRFVASTGGNVPATCPRDLSPRHPRVS